MTGSHRRSLSRRCWTQDADDAAQVESFNARIGGLVAYARIMRQAGRAADAARGERRLAELVTERVHFERADPRLQSRRAHQAYVPRYLGWTPELGRILADHAGDRLAGNLRDLDRELPVWYQAWGERMIGGENYVSSPRLSHALLLALAELPHDNPADLARYRRPTLVPAPT